MTQHVYLGNKDPHNGTTKLILEKDEDGVPTKEVSLGEEVSLTKEQVESLDSYNFEPSKDVSDDEIEEVRKQAEAEQHTTQLIVDQQQQTVDQPIVDDVVSSQPTLDKNVNPQDTARNRSAK